MDDHTKEFGAQFAEFVRVALQAESSKEPPFRGLVRDHLGVEPSELPVVAEDVPSWDHANLQLALEALIGAEGRSAELVGIGGGTSSTGWPTTPMSPSC